MGFGGGGGDQTVTQKFEPPEWTQQQWKDFTSGIPSAVDYTTNNRPYYQGGLPWDMKTGAWTGSQSDQNAVDSRVARFNGMQQDALLRLSQNSQDPLYNQDVNGYIRGVLNGNGSNWNTIQNWVNPYASAGNEFGGETNPYFERSLSAARNNAENTYNRTTAAQTDAAAAQAGAYGGSAYNELVGANQRALQDSLNQAEAGARNDQYNRAAQLEESRLGRGYQGTEAYFGRGMEDFNTMLGAEMQTLGQMPNISGMQTARTQAGLNAGDQLQSYQQDALNALQQAYGQEFQSSLLPWDVWSSLLSSASGQGRSGTTTQANTVNPWQMLMGGGLLGAGIYNATK